jgi:hypothetical protein
MDKEIRDRIRESYSGYMGAVCSTPSEAARVVRRLMAADGYVPHLCNVAENAVLYTLEMLNTIDEQEATIAKLTKQLNVSADTDVATRQALEWEICRMGWCYASNSTRRHDCPLKGIDKGDLNCPEYVIATPSTLNMMQDYLASERATKEEK